MKRIVQSLTKEQSRLENPKIRLGLQPFRYEDQNRVYIGLKDPLELSEILVLVPQDLYYLLEYFDGNHTIADLTSAYMRKFNNFLQADRLVNMIKKMDDGLLLDNTRYQKRLQEVIAGYRKQKNRKPSCAGSSYPVDKPSLVEELEKYRRQSVLSAGEIDKLKDKRIKGVVAPHIDPRLGGATYAAAYQALAVAQPIDLFVILGISHQPSRHPFIATSKDFDTPLGVTPTDEALLRDILDRCQTDFTQDEIVHRDEHSIEFQTVFLKYFVKSDFKILPVLCSFSHDMSTQEQRQFKEFVIALRAALEDYSGTFCLMASIDFSHVGPYYGSPFIPDSYVLTKVENADKAIFESLSQQNSKEFEQHFIRSNNQYNVCGYPALRTLLELLPPSRAQLLAYDNAIMDEKRSTVTFASMIFS